jgi:hypothetical protein
MALRPHYLGSEAFRRNWEVIVSRPSTNVLPDGSGPEWKPGWRHRPTVVRFVNYHTGLRYKATVNDWELPGAHPDPNLVYERILLDWAVPDNETNGPVLGESSRADGLQYLDLATDDSNLVESAARVAADKESALILRRLQQFDGLGTLAKFPLEVRAMIYEHSFDRLSEQRFWQCYHTKRAGLTRIGNTHSSPLPLICRLSTAIRNEVFDTVYREQVSQIVIGTELIVANFPLQAIIRPGEEVNAAHVKVNPSKELFIGIQFPAPRVVEGAAAVRSNLERVVQILNVVAAKKELPPIRVSFHTNAETRNRQYQYFPCDFEAYLGPLRNLRLPLRNPELKPSLVFTIDRLGNPKNDAREETCALIERAVLQPLEDANLVTLYRQKMIDFHVEMATYNRFHQWWPPLPAYWPSTQHIAAAATALDAFYTVKNESPPPWVTVALDELPGGGVVVDEGERRRRVGAIWEALNSTDRHVFHAAENWVEGWTTPLRSNPFWTEGRPRYWL